MTDNKYRILSLDEAAKTLLVPHSSNARISWLQPHYDYLIEVIESKKYKRPITLNDREYQIYKTKDPDLFRIKVTNDFVPMAFFRLTSIKRAFEAIQNGDQ